MASLTYSSTLQDRIAYRLWNSAYSALAPNQKADMDGTSAANPPVLGRAREAYMLVNLLGQWVQQIDRTAASVASTVDDAAEVWFTDEVAYRLSITHRPERREEMRIARDESRGIYYDTFTSALATGYAADVFTLTAQAIRYYVLRRIIQFVKPGQGVFPSPEEIDGVLFDVVTRLWYSRAWQFRRRRVTIDIATATNGSAPTINTASGETFSTLAVQRLYYSGGTNDFIKQATAEQMAALKADTTVATGKPQWFRIQKSGNTQTWIFHPYPDQAYTVSGEVCIALPGTTTSGVWDTATDTVPFAKFPVEFRPLLKELTLGKVMKNRNLGTETWDEAVKQLEEMAPQYDDHGDGDLDGPVRDVYHDAEAQGGWWPTDYSGVGGGM